ncbi:hypothetical protein VNO80_13519 [Phaseolus coccineus]|uniref:Uncharacterized protein n=1 Tax=Phaseolus coccineus TaxID=3886 RepID=A0AAN9N6E2_PHACN
MGPIEEADPIPTTEQIGVQVPRAEHQEEIEHQPEEMNPNRDGIEGPLIAESEANHGESAKVYDLLALLQPIRRLQDLHLNLHRFPLKAKHYLRLLGLEQEWNGRKLSLSSPPTGTSSRHEGMPDNRGLVCPFSSGLGNADQRKHSYTACRDACLSWGNPSLHSIIVFASIAPESADQRSEYQPLTARGGLVKRPNAICLLLLFALVHLVYNDLFASQVSGLCLRPGPESFNCGGRNGSRPLLMNDKIDSKQRKWSPLRYRGCYKKISPWGLVLTITQASSRQSSITSTLATTKKQDRPEAFAFMEDEIVQYGSNGQNKSNGLRGNRREASMEALKLKQMHLTTLRKLI